MDIVQLDLRGLTSLADYFVICTGRSDRQARAIFECIQLGMKEDHELRATRVDGATEASWILMDYGDVIVHVHHAGTARVLPARAALGRGSQHEA